MRTKKNLYEYYRMYEQFFAGNRKLFILVNIGLIILFGFLYKTMFTKDDFQMNDQPFELSTMMYYSTTTHTTLGFGEIYPKSKGAKYVTMVHSFFVFLLVCGFAFM